MKELGLYIHIPFCKQKCYYCDFISFPHKEEIHIRYIQALEKEIKDFKSKNKDAKISTIYIGGGTPSYIDSKYIKEILAYFNKLDFKEATIEINPGTVNKQKLKDYKEAGINRLSIGLQSTDDEILKQIGRIHKFQDFLNTYQLAKEVGFENINIDLMIGIPNQNIETIKKSLEEVIKLHPTHISVYSLIVEENTVISKLLEENKIKLPNEEEERNMYWYVKNFLELHEYNHYEISNFSKKGFESKHNLDCWKQEEYIGFGLAAHSYTDMTRYSNTNNLEQYMINCEQNNFDKNRIIQEEQNNFTQEQEYMLIGLRKIDGISINCFKNKFGENPIFVFKNELNKLVNDKLLQISSDNIKLTNKGIDLANLVWEKFI